MYLDELKMKLLFLNRPESDHYDEATSREKIDTLIEVCAFLLTQIPCEDDDDDCD